ncbi:MAG TPA: glycosyltransferase family 39 protein, partial [Tepidisphaeraceae bacterium]|nr:glycosyltransferase family 39 protein [Tepidisphaeraceae bacterium]
MNEPADPRPASPPRAGILDGRAWIVLGVVLVLALGARWFRSPVPSMEVPGTMGFPPSLVISDPPSMDELWHLALSTGRGSPFDRYPYNELLTDVPPWTRLTDAPPWWTVWTTQEHVVHPPLYVQTLRLWRELLGDGEREAIAYSVLWSCIAIVFVFLAARREFGLAVAGWCGIAMALAPTQIYYALEIRGYAMLAGLSAILLYLVVRIRHEGATRGNCVALSIALLAAMLTHYFAIFSCIAAGTMALLWARTGERRRVLLAGAVAAVVFVVTWLPFAIEQVQVVKEGTDFLSNTTGSYWMLVHRTLSMPLNLLAEPLFPSDAVLRTILGGTVLLSVGVLAIRKPALRVAAIWTLITLGGLLLLDLVNTTRHTSFIRYAAGITPGIILATLAIFHLPRARWIMHLGGITVAIFCLFYREEPIRMDSPAPFPIVQTLAPLLQGDETIVVHYDGDVRFYPSAVLLEFSNVPGLFPRDVIF